MKNATEAVRELPCVEELNDETLAEVCGGETGTWCGMRFYTGMTVQEAVEQVVGYVNCIGQALS